MKALLSLFFLFAVMVHGQTLGVLDNNPGNISADSIKDLKYWKGADGLDPYHHLHFVTPEDGAEALLKNLRLYRSRHGIHTIRKIIGRWIWRGLPVSEREAYILFVSRRLHVSPNLKLDLTDRDTLIGVARSIARYECGQEYGSLDWWKRLP
jgi:hypothetical protein